MKLVLPYPPSANRYWRVFRGVVVKSKQAREYQKGVAKLVLAQLSGKSDLPAFTGEVAVSLVAYRPAKRGDLDNLLKVTLDALRKVVYEDDSQVVRIVADRDDSHTRPRVEIMIEPRHRPGQQSVFELNDAPAPSPAPPHVRVGAVIREQRRPLTPRELASKAKSNVVSFRSTNPQSNEEK